MPLLLAAVLLAALAAPTVAALLTCLDKWRVLPWAQANRGRWWWLPAWLPADCYFCLGFWLGALVVLPALVALTGAPVAAALLAALPVAALQRHLL